VFVTFFLIFNIILIYLLYFGVDQQVPEDHNIGHEDAEHMQEETFDNEIWAWMQAEVQRVSTEQ